MSRTASVVIHPEIGTKSCIVTVSQKELKAIIQKRNLETLKSCNHFNKC
jgi:hypothetical protein